LTAWRSAALIIAALLLGSCSTMQFSYNNADVWLRWTADSYFDLQSAQEVELRQRVASFHDWHRARELPVYAELMQSAATRLGDGLSEQDISWAIENLRTRYQALMAQAIVEGAPMLVRLSPEQLAHLEDKLAHDNRKYSKEFLPDSQEKRVKARVRRMEELISDWIGSLSEEQEQRIVAMVRATPDRAATKLAERENNQREFAAILKSERRAETLVPKLSDLLENWESRRTAEQLDEAKLVEAQFYRLLLDLDRSLTPAQRVRAVRRFERYAADFAELARSAETAAKPAEPAAES
jgi:hypothetical protein